MALIATGVFRAVWLVVLSVVAAGCVATQTAAPAESSPTPAPPATTTREPPTMTARPDYEVPAVKSQTRVVARLLSDVPLTPRFADASYVVCAGGEADTAADTALAYTVQGRLDYYVGRAGSERDAERVVSALQAAGWTPRNDDWARDGIHRVPSKDRWTLYLDRHGLQLRLDMYADLPVVLFSVAGPCQPAPVSETRRLRQQPATPIDVPGTVGLTDSPLPTADGHVLPPRQP